MRYACAVTACVLLVAPRVATAQETATEKVAAADVIRRMNELERSLALPPLVARLTGTRDARRDAVVARAKDLMDRELLAMADDITRHPETGWKEERSVKILTDYDLDSASRNGISVAALNAVPFAYMKKFGATKVEDDPGRPVSFEETGTVATQIPGVGVTAHSSNGGYHTFEMEADALGEVGHLGFLVDAQTMAAVLYHFATDAPYRAAVKREFDGLQGLYSDYLAALRNAYPLPTVPEPTGN